MSKSYLAKIESNKDFCVYFGSRRSGKSYYEFKKLQENYNILKKTNDGLIYTKNCLEMTIDCLQHRINKSLNMLEQYENDKEANRYAPIVELLSILRGENNE